MLKCHFCLNLLACPRLHQNIKFVHKFIGVATYTYIKQAFFIICYEFTEFAWHRLTGLWTPFSPCDQLTCRAVAYCLVCVVGYVHLLWGTCLLTLIHTTFDLILGMRPEIIMIFILFHKHFFWVKMHCTSSVHDSACSLKIQVLILNCLLPNFVSLAPLGVLTLSLGPVAI